MTESLLSLLLLLLTAGAGADQPFLTTKGKTLRHQLWRVLQYLPVYQHLYAGIVFCPDSHLPSADETFLISNPISPLPPPPSPHLTESLNIKYYCDGWILTISCIDTTDQMLNKQEEELAGGSIEDSLSPH